MWHHFYSILQVVIYMQDIYTKSGRHREREGESEGTNGCAIKCMREGKSSSGDGGTWLKAKENKPNGMKTM
jgi:hypothetical protein